MLINFKSRSLVLIMIRSMSVSICSRFHAYEPIVAKQRYFRGTPLFDALVQGGPPHSGAWNFVTIN